MLLLAMIIFVFGVFLTQNVTAYLRQHEVPTSAVGQIGEFTTVEGKLFNQFGSLLRATYTLFKAISGGVSWEEIGDVLFYTGWGNGFIFICYIFFTVFSMLNIITGIFVDSAMASAQNDHDEVIQAQMEDEESTLRQLTKIFQDADTDESGTLCLLELENHFQAPRVAAHLASMGLAVSEARAMFTLLDGDSSGNVGIEEFVFGCLRMKGNARSIDLQTLMYENKKMIHKNSSHFHDILRAINKVKHCQEKLESRLPQLRRTRVTGNGVVRHTTFSRMTSDSNHRGTGIDTLTSDDSMINLDSLDSDVSKRQAV